MSDIRRVSLKAVALGAITDIVGTNLLLLPVAIVATLGVPQSAGGSRPNIAELFTEDLRLYGVALLLGSIASIAGGWVAARIARRDELLHGALSAIACVAGGVYGLFAASDKLPLSQHLAFLVLSPALGALGGVLQARFAARRATAIEPHAPPRAPRRVGLVVNGVLLAFAILTAVIFGSFGLAGYLQDQPAMVTGAGVITAVVLAGTWLLAAARRALRGDSRRHWSLHACGIALVSIPIVLIALVSSHVR